MHHGCWLYDSCIYMQSVSITTSIVNSNTTQHYVIKFVTHGTAAHASAVLADDF
jgi:hypothetical protein